MDKLKKTIYAALVVLSLIVVYAAAGGSDCGRMPFKTALIIMVSATLAFGCFTYLAKKRKSLH